ncbi:MAG: GIY-YIG nuclease family protein [Trueperaceae bacterium]|nr:GIY-YIG nuclease family protein [Trueperaceae bacterium]
MSMFGLIYLARNTVTNECYIGATIQPLRNRWNKHVSVALRGGSDCPKLHPAIRKYGKAAFEIQILAQAKDADDLVALEEQFIREWDTVCHGYNVLYGRKAQ